MSNKRQRAEQFGRKGEMLATFYLRLLGHRILATREKTPVGEVDLIIKRGQQIIFVEVKARKDRAGLAIALAQINQPRLRRAAQYWLALHPQYASQSQRFDVIGLVPFAWPVHIKNAMIAHDDF